MNATTTHIWEEFHTQLFNFIKKRVKDTDASKDILQDVFVKIHLKLNTLTNEDKLSSWVYQITRHSILDYYKKQKIQIDIPESLAEIQEEKTYNAEMTSCLTPMIEQLSGDFKEAIMQTELGNLSQKDYAEKLGISYSGAKSRVQRARQQLNTLFHECCTIESDKYGNVIEHNCNKDCGCN